MAAPLQICYAGLFACAINGDHVFWLDIPQMTLKFFSLFFWQVCKLNPVAVSSISLAAPLCISVAAATCQRLSPRCAVRLQLLPPPLCMFGGKVLHHVAPAGFLKGCCCRSPCAIVDLPPVAGEVRLHSPRHHGGHLHMCAGSGACRSTWSRAASTLCCSARWRRSRSPLRHSSGCWSWYAPVHGSPTPEYLGTIRWHSVRMRCVARRWTHSRWSVSRPITCGGHQYCPSP